MVVFERQYGVSSTLDDRLRNRFLAAHRIHGHHGTAQVEQLGQHQFSPPKQPRLLTLATRFLSTPYIARLPWRNCFLAGAYELRNGIPQGETANTSSPDVIRAMSTELFLNFLAIRMDSRKADGLRFTINLITPDNGEKFLIELENATLTNIQGFQSDKPDLTVTINRSDLEKTMMGAKPLEAQIADGAAKVQGDVSILKKLAATMVDFDPRFEVLPGTKGRSVLVGDDAFEATVRNPAAE